ncbi:DUF4160 domain-containing protein [Limosilactobacillus sp.]|uniref:DUF4160 domain-containing protein n=1 Tax=Limosilactobacillus sp. TaxID=2773925 RepID=UPI0025B98508|nr:DUF4160 domain-containing protein [Limosilactobacillus sp.]MCH3922151.1 DUF4160 domain-containing protein [Limosilactobacillus sp.]MCH3928922.1 DUF4160 domain-containing protein [Limosilactobacillus sp.]
MWSLPNLFNFAGYCIYFWSNESGEPIHVHVSVKRPSNQSTKFWLLKDGSVELANNHAELSRKSIKRLSFFITQNYNFILAAWKNYFEVDSIKFYK